LSIHNTAIQVLQSPDAISINKNIKNKQTKKIAVKKINVLFGKDDPHMRRCLHFCSRKVYIEEEDLEVPSTFQALYRKELLGMKENFICHFKSSDREINRPQLCSDALLSVIIDVRVGSEIIGLCNPSPYHTAALFFTVHSPLPFLI